ncbi:MAG: N-(5'-phosphoribosyl)anthranilate isomerase [Verrucomicrobia subdivision 3 bacterium]|nr:N-(5'-phosphoribosyl)anthranilate isomerase [Limisphaerales bacterium]MCS1414183.1 N-(5'-phosphoribosyl)anthranilate isomerase [Limisphaerales bacterium]
MTVRTKICGITREADALAAVRSGVDALGFMFYPKSKRYTTPQRAHQIIRTLPPLVSRVGIFVNESIEQIMQVKETCELDVIQLHGDETPEFCEAIPGKVIKAFRLKSPETVTTARNFATDAWLFDSYEPDQRGGTGSRFNWDWIQQASPLERPFFVAGGLNSENVAACVKTTQPYAVDVSSGVEDQPGLKNAEKMKQFLLATRTAAAELMAPSLPTKQESTSATHD